MITTESWRGRMVLMLAHSAGMIDLVALPVWVGTALMGQFGFSAPIAGGMVTCYLLAAAAASLLFAPRFHRIFPKLGATLGYATATVAFVLLAFATRVEVMFVLHLLAGFGAGTGLSFTHGTIGRSPRPHRLFAVATFGMGISGIALIAIAQTVVPAHGGHSLFVVFAIVLGAATAASALAFPHIVDDGVSVELAAARRVRPISAGTWWAIGGITLMAVTQAMTFSFLERIGTERGFGVLVSDVLVVQAFVNLFSSLLAGMMERKFPPLPVALAGAVVQAALALAITLGTVPAVYAVGGCLLVSAMIVTHTFAFGWLSQNDGTGRAVALTPAMLMSGAAIGPICGGIILAQSGTAALGAAAVAIDGAAFSCYLLARRRSRGAAMPLEAAAQSSMTS